MVQRVAVAARRSFGFPTARETLLHADFLGSYSVPFDVTAGGAPHRALHRHLMGPNGYRASRDAITART